MTDQTQGVDVYPRKRSPRVGGQEALVDWELLVGASGVLIWDWEEDRLCHR